MNRNGMSRNERRVQVRLRETHLLGVSRSLTRLNRHLAVVHGISIPLTMTDDDYRQAMIDAHERQHPETSRDDEQ